LGGRRIAGGAGCQPYNITIGLNERTDTGTPLSKSSCVYPRGAKLNVHFDTVRREQGQVWDLKLSALKQQPEITDIIGKAAIAALQPLSIARAPIATRSATPSKPSVLPSRPAVTNWSSHSSATQGTTKSTTTPTPTPGEPVRLPTPPPGRPAACGVDPGAPKSPPSTVRGLDESQPGRPAGSAPRIGELRRVTAELRKPIADASRQTFGRADFKSQFDPPQPNCAQSRELGERVGHPDTEQVDRFAAVSFWTFHNRDYIHNHLEWDGGFQAQNEGGV
jgi:hypothetical protein